ncbi:hypothetical protein LAJ19_14400 (plasmid) [Deinococcus taeanensis]|uniref:hypothetical protein n=1 Tax=Deinococcus taeanensis TaxID=2737050 RepID=UPI001CDCCA97|nr:hypothetical protein [Deinococcus taeanensis]UBV44355.1 hypothetical protein LAJ19_14400 [Deinococcus taeanensis]
MNRARAQWQTLTPSALALFSELRACLSEQPPTSRWTLERRAQSLILTAGLERAWQQERVDLDALRALDALTAHLDLSATVTCRSALEGLQGLFRRVVEITYEELAPGD